MLTATGLELWSPVTASLVTARRLRTLGLFDSCEAGFASAAGFTSGAASFASPSATSGFVATSGFAATSAFGVASTAGFASGAAGVSVAALPQLLKQGLEAPL